MQTWGEKMNGSFKPATWGVACCCFALIMAAAFVRLGIDPMTLAMP
jgi:hypothetical protein